uniref:Uncharacterized protein n=1 Tax=Romanomermis culicivorax TaxID=13658 RepID=A0A915J4X1_ROMCU
MDLICLKLGLSSWSSFQQSFINCIIAGSTSVSWPRLTDGRKGGLSHLATLESFNQILSSSNDLFLSADVKRSIIMG